MIYDRPILKHGSFSKNKTNFYNNSVTRDVYARDALSWIG